MSVERPRNVLWILTDQQRHDAFGAAGNRVVRTPNIDRIAASGVRLSRSYCNNPVCMPSRASLHTGRYPRAHGSWANGVSLPEGERTLADALGGTDYRTALVGKAHLQSVKEPYEPSHAVSIESMNRRNGVPGEDVDRFWRSWTGPYYGFEWVQLALQHGDRTIGGGHYDLWVRETHPDQVDLLQRGRAVKNFDNPLQTWHSPMRAEARLRAVDRRGFRVVPSTSIATNRSSSSQLPRPARASLSARAVLADVRPGGHFATASEPGRARSDAAPLPQLLHGPSAGGRLPPSGLTGPIPDAVLRDLTEMDLRQMMAAYYGLVSLTDAAIGLILDELDRLGLVEDTLVVFGSDHGELFGDHGLVFKGPYHYEGLVRIPTLLSAPGALPAGTVADGLASSVDIVPTILDLLEVPVPDGVQGTSLVASLTDSGAAPARDWALVEFRENAHDFHAKTIVTARHKLTHYPGIPFGELFDLEDDPGEYENRWDDPAYSSLRAELSAALLDALCETEDPLPPRLARS